MDAIRDTAEAAGMTMDDLVYVQIFCSDVVATTRPSTRSIAPTSRRSFRTRFSAQARCCSERDSRSRASRSLARNSVYQGLSRKGRRRRAPASRHQRGADVDEEEPEGGEAREIDLARRMVMARSCVALAP